MVSEKEQKEIFEQVKQVLEYNTGVKCDTTWLHKQWYNSKKGFVDDHLKGKLIYEFEEPVTFTLTEEEKREMLYAFLDWLNNDFTWSTIPSSVADLAALYDFLADNLNDFFANKLSKTVNMYVKDINNSEKLNLIIIPKGIKVIKAFKYFIHEPHLLSVIQDKASEYLQKDKLSGILCLSVHPLDYLSISENTLGWRSCHALNGDCAAGNLSYMIDTSTLVCYLKSTTDAQIPRFGGVPWNNKKWRMLLFLSQKENMIFAGRQYPFATDAGLRAVRKLLLDELLFTNSSWMTDWHNERIEQVEISGLLNKPLSLDSPYYYLGYMGGLVSINDLIKSNKHQLHYNDLIYSTVYKKPYYLLHDHLYGYYNHNTKFFIGEDVLCPCCSNNVLYQSSELICKDCKEHQGNLYEDIVFCDFCGEQFNRNNIITLSQNDHICPECQKKYMTHCVRCGKPIFFKAIKYKSDEGFICQDCDL